MRVCCCFSRLSVSADLQHSSQCGVMSGSSQGQSRHSFTLKGCQGSGPPDAPGAASAPLARNARAMEPTKKRCKAVGSAIINAASRTHVRLLQQST